MVHFPLCFTDRDPIFTNGKVILVVLPDAAFFIKVNECLDAVPFTVEAVRHGIRLLPVWGTSPNLFPLSSAALSLSVPEPLYLYLFLSARFYAASVFMSLGLLQGRKLSFWFEHKKTDYRFDNRFCFRVVFYWVLLRRQSVGLLPGRAAGDSHRRWRKAPFIPKGNIGYFLIISIELATGRRYSSTYLLSNHKFKLFSINSSSKEFIARKQQISDSST